MGGIPPFLGDTVEDILQEMLNNEIDYTALPEEITEEARQLISAFLTIDPTERMGYKGQDEICDTSWFSDLDWATLRQNQGPFVPQLTGSEDTDYFKNGRQEQLTACMSLLGAIKGEEEGDDDDNKPQNNILGLQQVGGAGVHSVMGFGEEEAAEANLFIDKYLKEEGESDDEEDETGSFMRAQAGGTKTSGDRNSRGDSDDVKFSVKEIGVVKNFSYKNLVRLHSRNKAQMQRQSFFVRAGGRTRFGAAGPDLLNTRVRLSNATT